MDSSYKILESMTQAVWYNRWTIGKFQQYLKGDILEIGCGIGNFTNHLLHFGNVWAIDINVNYIKKTKKLTKKYAKVGFGDIEKGRYFFKKKKFDTIICINVLEHVKDDHQALNNLYQLLTPHGHLIILVPAHPFLYGAIDKAIGHYRRYNSKLLDTLKSQKFNIIFVRNINFIGALGWFFKGRILKRSGISKTELRFFDLLAPFFLFLEDKVKLKFGTSILIVAKKES